MSVTIKKLLKPRRKGKGIAAGAGHMMKKKKTVRKAPPARRHGRKKRSDAGVHRGPQRQQVGRRSSNGHTGS